jgi:hypothetical protein
VSEEEVKDLYQRLVDNIDLEKHLKELFGNPFEPSPFVHIQFNTKEASMALEKRAVVNTPKEKTAHKKIKDEKPKAKPAKEKK